MSRYDKLFEKIQSMVEAGLPASHRRSSIARSIAEARRSGARGNPEPKRKPPEAGIAVPAIPPKGPLPKQGGAEAPLEFD